MALWCRLGRMAVAVLMYHGVGEPADPSEGVRYTVTEQELLDQLAAMHGLPILPPREFTAGSQRRGVVLTFDDGDATVLTFAAPRLVERGLPAILFMTSGFVGRANYLTAAGLRELATMGFTIGAHGATHRFLNTLSDADLDEELRGARASLEDILGQPVTDLSLPGGRGGPRVTARARAAGFQTIYTSEPGWNGGGLDRFAIRRSIVRRGMATEHVRRLAACATVTHAKEVANMTARGFVRRAVGEDRYHRLTARLLAAVGRQ